MIGGNEGAAEAAPSSFARKETQDAVVLRLIREAGREGITVARLKAHPDVRAGTAENVRARVVHLEQRGMIEIVGGRRRVDAVWAAVPEDRIPAPPSKEEREQAKSAAAVEAVWTALSNPEIRAGLKARADDSRQSRRNLALVRMYEEEDERRAAEAQKEAIKMAKAAGEHALRRHAYWERLDKEIEAFLMIVGPYVAEFDHLPKTIPAQMRIVDRNIERTIRALRILQRKMFPGREEGSGDIGQGSYITIK